MDVKAINNPRKKNGDFGDVSCDVCGTFSGALVALSTVMLHRPYEMHRTVVCKGCLLKWVTLINKTMLKDAVDKGRSKGDSNV